MNMKSSVVVALLIMLGILAGSPAFPKTPWNAAHPGVALAQTPPVCTTERLELKIALDDIFVTQRPDGYLSFSAEDSLFYYHPVMAGFALDVYRQTADTAFLERARVAIAGYFNYLLVHHDTDGDFLIERTAYRHFPAGGSASMGVEGPGFNAILALDMLCLSQICLELKLPVDALFWYQGMKTISSAIIASNYDNVAGFFLPTTAFQTSGMPSDRIGVYLALSALPTYFHRELGDNISGSILRNYVLKTRPVLDEIPSNYLNWDFDPSDLNRTHADERFLRAMLLLDVLEQNGFSDDATRFAGQVRQHAAGPTSPAETQPDGLYAQYLRCIFANSAGPPTLLPKNFELELLDVLVFQKALLDGPQTAELREGIAAVRQFVTSYTPAHAALTPPQTATTDDVDRQAVMQSVRDVYIGISALREKWRAHTLYPPRVRDKLAGFDIYAATAGLWDDVIETLHDAETTIARLSTKTEGFDITVTLQNETSTPGAPVKIKCGLSSMAGPVDIRSVVIFRDQAIDTLLSANPPLHIEPGAPPHELPYMLAARAGMTSVIHSLRFSVEVRFADNGRHRYHWRRGIYVTEPLTYAVTYPRGTVLAGSSVPIRIDVDKHVTNGAVIHSEWYSPAGLRPKEGRSVETWMAEQTDQATIDLNILVPAPCRPGAFPFVLKLFANGVDLGTVQSSLFRHYQWLLVGPFTEKLNALDAPYPPETRVNLLETYPGAGQRVSWIPLPQAAYADAGAISLDSYLPQGSVGFLYTVIHSEVERPVTVILGSYVPAALYLNGDEIIRTPGARANSEPTSERAGVVLSEGMNNILIKILAHGSPTIFFQLGEDQDMTSDEFSNNLWDLVDGYKELTRRGTGASDEPGETQRRVTLTYANPNANSVAVVGNFNGWSSTNSTMHKNKYGDWEINLYLAPGRYAYRFLINNSEEILDPVGLDQEPDGYGGRNSVLLVQ